MRPAVRQKHVCCGSAFGQHSADCYMAPISTPPTECAAPNDPGCSVTPAQSMRYLTNVCARGEARSDYVALVAV